MDSEEQSISVAQIRGIICNAIAPTIDLFRESARQSGDDFFRGALPPGSGSPSDEELDIFLAHCPTFDLELVERLIDPGLLGFEFVHADLSLHARDEIAQSAAEWGRSRSWLAADEPFLAMQPPAPIQTEVWSPSTHGWTLPSAWTTTSPSAVCTAADLLRSGRLLHEMDWHQFEDLVAELLRADGYQAEVTQRTRDGGVDVVAVLDDPVLGKIKSVWQAKKYGPRSLVRLSEVRELATVRNDEHASKAMIVTTSRLTKDALQYVRRDVYRLGAQDGPMLESWVRRIAFGQKGN